MSDIKITNRMKDENIGEHFFTVYKPCPKCALHLDGLYDDIDCLCNGSEDKTYKKVIMVPWDTCKDIYKSMRESYERDISAVKVDPYQHIHVGETGWVSSRQECASVRDRGGFPIFEVSVDKCGVEIIEACEHFYNKRMPKAEAIAALKELIHYIESNSDD